MQRALTILAWLLAAPAVLAGPREAIAAALEDCRKLPAPIAQQTRYLDLSALPTDYLAEVGRDLDYQANRLSRDSQLTKLRRVRADLLAVIITDYGWKRETWEQVVQDPYFYERQPWPGGVWRGDGRHYAAGTFKFFAPRFAGTAELTVLTLSNAPITSAAWWFVQSVRQLSLGNEQTGIGYYDWLGIKNRKDFERLAKFSEKDSLELGKEIRAVLERSGVATQNRGIVRFKALTGGYWVTLDATASTAKRNALRNLDPKDYAHDAEEIYAVLPNELFAQFLGSAAGERQDSAPDFIGGDDSPLRAGNDHRIHIGLACDRCHVEGLRPIEDWARRTLRAPLSLNVVDPLKRNEFRRQYYSKLERAREQDNAVYAEALKEVNGRTPAENAKAVAKLWNWYVLRDRSLDDIAGEMGVEPAKLKAALISESAPPPDGTGRIDGVLSGLLQFPESKIRVEMIEELQPELWRIYLARSK